MKEQLLNILQEFPGSKYRLFYYNLPPFYKEKYCWTMPDWLTEKKITNICNDISVAKVAILFPNGDLTMLAH